MRAFDGAPYAGVDLLAGGLPCPPFSKAGKQLGDADERNLFPEAIRLVRQMQPRALMIENVRGILDAVFEDYRTYPKVVIGKRCCFAEEVGGLGDAAAIESDLRSPCG